LGLFGGGYLRLAPQALIKWGVGRLDAERRPLVAYIHPREIDMDQPRLPLSLSRRFKSYVNLHTTLAKVEWLCRNRRLGTMRSLCEAWTARTAPDEA
jgi:hypothetical protein